jgi:hypothetical protein|nr:hypothetical protein [uncultured Emticicia sp.]
MKKMISNFGASLLSREQMKKVKGGLLDNCAVCSQGANGGGTCGGHDFSRAEADSLADEFNSSNDGYTYFVHCS